MSGTKTAIALRDNPPTAVLRAMVVSLFLVVLAPCGQAEENPSAHTGKRQKQSETVRKPQPRITVSTKTTHVVQPLDAEGYVDYLAAVNRTASAGVTVENNAGVWFVRAYGASAIQGTARAAFFKMLAIDPLPEQGDYFRPWLAGSDNRESADLENAMVEPWSERRFPRFSAWLKSNDRPLGLVVEGTRRPRYYVPWVEAPDSKSLMSVLLPTEQASREWARALVLRAMLRLHEGKVADAENDLLACHRLGRLVGEGPSSIGTLVCAAIDSVAFAGDAALMQHGKLSAQEALAYQQRLRGLPSLPVEADKLDRYERLAFLDAVTGMARGQQAARPASGNAPTSADSRIIADRSIRYWNGALQTGNEEFDRWVSATRRPTLAQRKQGFATLAQNLRRETSVILGKTLHEQMAAAEDPQALQLVVQKFRNMASEFLANPSKLNQQEGSVFKTRSPEETGRQVGKVLVYLLLPAIDSISAACDRERVRESLDQLGFALAAYRRDHGAYPEKLELLTPRYIANVPHDVCTEQALRYTRQGDRFLLYSAGANGVDDGGRSFGSQPPGDDIVLQIPRPAR